MKRTEAEGTELQAESSGAASGGLDNGEGAMKDTRQG